MTILPSGAGASRGSCAGDKQALAGRDRQRRAGAAAAAPAASAVPCEGVRLLAPRSEAAKRAAEDVHSPSVFIRSD